MKNASDWYREGYAAQTWRLSECPYIRRDAREAWQAGAWAWMCEQRRARDVAA